MEIILQQVISNLHAFITEKRAVVTHDTLPEIEADPLQMTLLLQNLIQNGIKFQASDRSAQIHISAGRSDKKSWIFSVRDNGIGIEKKYLERIFVIFQRLHGVSDYPGTGLGLAICKKIAEHHGGKIWVESEFGKGSNFYFSIAD